MIEKNWKELIKPTKLSVKRDEQDPFTATIVAEPIERGFGVTIGNSLRRILLSSISENSGKNLVKFWSNSCQILGKFWSNSGQILVKFWLNSCKFC